MQSSSTILWPKDNKKAHNLRPERSNEGADWPKPGWKPVLPGFGHQFPKDSKNIENWMDLTLAINLRRAQGIQSEEAPVAAGVPLETE
ncbi:unnamed protein product [Caenorhabditis angaria]|uniref:Uncharacterized protein n=1 Tax=Caenorhabditis angaria TaxID=860376 RepID=A0A9P1IFD1_9PELO|nr:unnamed protein product [Caenorhabditis angaria]